MLLSLRQLPAGSCYMSVSSLPPLPPKPARRRYAIVGLGSRHELYQDGIEKTHAPWAELVAVCDTNQGRIDLARRRSAKNGAIVPPGYLAGDFQQMLRERRPEVVIVTTADSAHHDYLIRAMEAGCDVITEKPMTIDAGKCRQILETQRRTGRRCRVTFNYRYSPPRSQVKELLMSGAIGDVLSVDFHWLLNTHHGADYFRREYAGHGHFQQVFQVEAAGLHGQRRPAHELRQPQVHERHAQFQRIGHGGPVGPRHPPGDGPGDGGGRHPEGAGALLGPGAR